MSESISCMSFMKQITSPISYQRKGDVIAICILISSSLSVSIFQEKTPLKLPKETKISLQHWIFKYYWQRKFLSMCTFFSSFNTAIEDRFNTAIEDNKENALTNMRMTKRNYTSFITCVLSSCSALIQASYTKSKKTKTHYIKGGTKRTLENK